MLYDIDKILKNAFFFRKKIFAIFVFPIIPHRLIFFRKHVNYEEDKNKVPMNKPYNIHNENIYNGIFHISFFKALLINEGERE